MCGPPGRDGAIVRNLCLCVQFELQPPARMIHPRFMDAISGALAAIREGSASYQRLEGFAAWESSAETGKQARLGMVSRGVAWLCLDGNGPIRLAEGDGFLLP